MKLPQTHDRRVLLGEADPALREHLHLTLTSWGYTVEPYADGVAALERLAAGDAPALALLDFDLPGISAPEMIHALHRRKREIPVWTLVMCSDPSVEQVVAATEAGVGDFLAKPVQELELRVRLQTAERVQSLHGDLLRSVEAVKFHASHDPLTGLWNRETLLSLLFQETDRVQRMRMPLSILLLDVDNFAQLNAEHGYHACDRVLRQMAERLRRFLRSYDLIGRSGEDEFLIALPGCAFDDAAGMAERLRVHMRDRAFDVKTACIPVRISVGVAQSRGRSPLVVLREAERALAEAKSSGRDCVRRYHAGRSETRPAASPEEAAPGDTAAAPAAAAQTAPAAPKRTAPAAKGSDTQARVYTMPVSMRKNLGH